MKEKGSSIEYDVFDVNGCTMFYMVSLDHRFHSLAICASEDDLLERILMVEKINEDLNARITRNLYY